MRTSMKILPFIISATLLTGCGVSQDFSDLDQFMAEENAKPGKPVPPVPQFDAYEAFTYSAANRRSPFSAPIKIEFTLELEEEPQDDVKPDFDRPRELLESFAIGELKMVGTLKRADDGDLFALISDNGGGIHRVKEGQYMGKNHGKVVSVDDAKMQLIEIVPNGRGGWLERPRTMALDEQ